MNYTEEFHTVRDCRIRLMRAGAGSAVVFLHGAGAASDWLPFMGALAGHHQFFAPEHPGFGYSETPPWLRTVGDLAEFYLKLFATLNLSGIHLVGNSLGGWLAMEIAVRDAARLKSLHLLAPAGVKVDGVEFPNGFMWSQEETVRRLYHSAELAEAVLAQPVSEAEQLRNKRSRANAVRLVARPWLHNPALPARLGNITLPTQIIWGESDRVIPAALGPALAPMIPGASLTVLPQCGHLPHVECAELTVDLLRQAFAAATR